MPSAAAGAAADPAVSGEPEAGAAYGAGVDAGTGPALILNWAEPVKYITASTAPAAAAAMTARNIINRPAWILCRPVFFRYLFLRRIGSPLRKNSICSIPQKHLRGKRDFSRGERRTKLYAHLCIT